MRPLRLHLSGFMAFRQPTEVGFDDLELFAIAGPTGAGKTTLLDAITYALYGQTARLGSKVGDAIVSPGLSQGTVVLEFHGRQGTYRVTRLSERKSGRSPKNETRIEELKADGKWRQLPESEKLREADHKLLEIVGLDYDSFTRAVLLPQGAFDQFLRGGAAERNRLLTGLLGLERVRIMQQRAGEVSRQAAARAAWIHESLARDYVEATAERQCALQEELAALSERRQGLEQDQVRLSAERQALEEVKRLLDEARAVEERLAKLQAQAAEVTQARQALARAREAALVLPRLEALLGVQQRLKQVQVRQAELANVLAQAAPGLAAAEAALAEAQQAAARIPGLNAQLEELAAVNPLLKQLQARGGNLALAKQAEAGVRHDEALWEAQQSRRAQLPALKRAAEDVATGEKVVRAASVRLAEDDAAVARLTSELEAVTSQGQAARERFEQAEAAYLQAEAQDRAAALRAHLHAGEPCPVCFQVVQTMPVVASLDVAALATERDLAKEALTALLEHHAQVKSQLETAKARREDRAAEVSQAESGLARYHRQLAELATELGTGDPDQLSAQLEAERLRLLAALARSILDKTHGLDPEAAQQRLSAERERLARGLTAAQEAYGNELRRRDQLQTEQRLLAAQLAELLQESSTATQAFEMALQHTSLAGADEVVAAALPAARLSALEARITAFDSQVDQLSHQAVGLQAKLAGRTLDEAHYQQLVTQQASVLTELESTLQRSGAATSELQRLALQLDKAKALRQEAVQREAEHARYHTLYQDLRSNRFPDYLLARTQQQLAWRASDIVREVTQGRFDLVFEAGDYGVIDAWSGLGVRSARTLSGGETFIASLALALALSDTLAGHTALGALFLDEGFGTLDAETLDAVTGVLQALTANGRMVGVISHVAALTERLPARLLVHKGVEGSSVSWDR
ncbi:MAG: SMC family ATPase [Truepera sp.]|nr:SMC family ATPase [Truepera sp.]